MPGDTVARWIARPSERTPPSDVELARAVAAGIAIDAADALIANRVLEPEEIYTLVIPRRTLAHRRQHGQRLSPEESDRLARVAVVLGLAEGTLGDAAKARRWLHEPNRALAGDAPVVLLASEHGARAVKAVLGRIGHGVYS
jgi:putative toxin-antitoxin system antitoxin component (TIGR02293 family)